MTNYSEIIFSNYTWACARMFPYRGPGSLNSFPTKQLTEGGYPGRYIRGLTLFISVPGIRKDSRRGLPADDRATDTFKTAAAFLKTAAAIVKISVARSSAGKPWRLHFRIPGTEIKSVSPRIYRPGYRGYQKDIKRNIRCFAG